MSPRPNSTAMRRRCFVAHRYIHPTLQHFVMNCHICSQVIDPVKESDWVAEHVLPRNCGGSDDTDNVKPAHGSCSTGKTSKEASVRAQVKRGADRHYGIKRPSSRLRKPEGMEYDWRRGRYVKDGEKEV